MEHWASVTRSARVAVILLSACSGEVIEPGGARGTAGSTALPPVPPPSPPGAPTPTPGVNGALPYAPSAVTAPEIPARVWRLTHAQYAASVTDFIGVAVDTATFEEENDSGVFQNVSNVGFVRRDLAADYYDAAEKTAGALTESQLRPFAGACGALTAACKAEFLANVARKGFRRAATPEEISDLAGTFDLAAGSAEALLPFRAVIQQVLTSPLFLYRTEVGAPPDVVKPTFRITDQEAASLLSFSLLGRPPSANLLAAADRGELSNSTSMRTHVAALLADAGAAAPLLAFLGQWLMLNKFQNEAEVYKFPNLFPNFDAVRSEMLTEANAFLSARGGMNSTLTALLTSPVPAPSGALGAFYTAPGAGAGVRTGWLGLGAFLSTVAHSDIGSPTLRGLFIRDRMLCQKFVVPQNVPNLADVEAMGAAPKSTRELYDMHKLRPDCAACHDSIDPIGYVFEDFDAAGRFRKQELFRNQTVPVNVDTSGELINTDVNRPLANHTDLAQALAASEWVRECAAIHAFRFYMGYGADVERGLPPVLAGYQALTGGGTMKDLIAAVMTSETTFARSRQ